MGLYQSVEGAQHQPAFPTVYACTPGTLYTRVYFAGLLQEQLSVLRNGWLEHKRSEVYTDQREIVKPMIRSEKPFTFL